MEQILLQNGEYSNEVCILTFSNKSYFDGDIINVPRPEIYQFYIPPDMSTHWDRISLIFKTYFKLMVDLQHFI